MWFGAVPVEESLLLMLLTLPSLNPGAVTVAPWPAFNNPKSVW